jgi:hypothetical protein
VTEHAAEFQLLKNFAQAFDFSGDIVDRALVVFFDGHIEQVTGIGQATGQIVDGLNNLRQRGALTAQALGVFGLVPDARIFELAVYFDQTIMFVIVVKDTPE